MNNEFEWRNQMRKLGDPVEPVRDLWPAVAAQIAAQAAAQRSQRARFPRIGMAIAASLIVAVAAGLVAQRTQQHRPAVAEDSYEDAIPRPALDWAQPNNPTLAAAAQDLDGASAQLQQALETNPDAVFLVGMLNRTNGQRMRLLQQAPYAG
jgi:hypothetical protein